MTTALSPEVKPTSTAANANSTANASTAAKASTTANVGYPTASNPLTIKSPDHRLLGVIDLNGGMLARLIYQGSAPASVIAAASATTQANATAPANTTTQALTQIPAYPAEQQDLPYTYDLLHQAPWLKSDYYKDAPGLEQHLSGEWACVPFGWISADSELFKKNAAHGLPCHSTWQVLAHSAHEIKLSYTYPEDYPLEKIERTVTLTNQGVNFSYTVTAKRDCALPLGAHPCFPNQGPLNEFYLEIKGDGIVYPQDCEPHISRLKSGAHFSDLHHLPLKLAAVPGQAEATIPGATEATEATAASQVASSLETAPAFIDATHLPWDWNSEEIVQMLHPEGEAILTYPKKGLKLILSWDSSKVPTCLLWLSQQGRTYEPWGGKNRCLGIEPIAGAWDFAPLSLAEDNPVAKQGVATKVNIKANAPFTFDYAITVTDL